MRASIGRQDLSLYLELLEPLLAVPRASSEIYAPDTSLDTEFASRNKLVTFDFTRTTSLASVAVLRLA